MQWCHDLTTQPLTSLKSHPCENNIPSKGRLFRKSEKDDDIGIAGVLVICSGVTTMNFRHPVLSSSR